MIIAVMHIATFVICAKVFEYPDNAFERVMFWFCVFMVIVSCVELALRIMEAL